MRDEEVGETSLITSEDRTGFGVWFGQGRAFWAESLWSLLVVMRAVPVQARGGGGSSAVAMTLSRHDKC